jgi:hypothetical protein
MSRKENLSVLPLLLGKCKTSLFASGKALYSHVWWVQILWDRNATFCDLFYGQTSISGGLILHVISNLTLQKKLGAQ